MFTLQIHDLWPRVSQSREHDSVASPPHWTRLRTVCYVVRRVTMFVMTDQQQKKKASDLKLSIVNQFVSDVDWLRNRFTPAADGDVIRSWLNQSEPQLLPELSATSRLSKWALSWETFDWDRCRGDTQEFICSSWSWWPSPSSSSRVLGPCFFFFLSELLSPFSSSPETNSR